MRKEIKIIISSSKTFKKNIPASNNPRPEMINTAKAVFWDHIAKLDIQQTKKIYKISNKLTEKVFKMHKTHGKPLHRAIDAYGGTIFKELDIKEEDIKWLDKHVLILSALYGIVKPSETIGLYRLDFNTKLDIDLKQIWKKQWNNYLRKYEVYNLASKEYTEFLDIPLKEIKLPEGIKQIKKARGIALNNIIKNKEI